MSQTYFVLRPTDIDLKYLVAVLNSRVCHYWFEKKGKKQGDALQIDKGPLLEVPVIRLSNGSPAQKRTRDQLLALVDEIRRVSALMDDATVPNEVENLARQITALDRQVDQLVYELYGLTDEEIRVVEDATS